MAIYNPAGVASARNRNAIWVDAIANEQAPKLTEVTSLTASLDISCWLNVDWDGFSAEQNKEADERWCGTKFESMGDVEYTVGDLVYVVDPQATTSDGTARAAAILTEGKRGFLAENRYPGSGFRLPGFSSPGFVARCHAEHGNARGISVQGQVH